MPMILCDLESHLLLFETFLTAIHRKKYHVFSKCLRMDQKVHVACNFNCLFEAEGLVKVTGSQMHCKCVNIPETKKDTGVATI